MYIYRYASHTPLCGYSAKFSCLAAAYRYQLYTYICMYVSCLSVDQVDPCVCLSVDR